MSLKFLLIFISIIHTLECLIKLECLIPDIKIFKTYQFITLQ